MGILYAIFNYCSKNRELLEYVCSFSGRFAALTELYAILVMLLAAPKQARLKLS